MLRSTRERVYQTIALEIGGIALAAPLYALFFSESAETSFLLIVALSLALMIWSPLHNTIFDWVDWRATGRVASSRPHGLRMLHAVSHEVTSAVLTLPLIMLIGGHGFWIALGVDLGLTLFYTVYIYFFHIAYDRMRPVGNLPKEGAKEGFAA
ncbi:MAG: chlorhexidine efflux transporter [Rhizobiaceae bacterium]